MKFIDKNSTWIFFTLVAIIVSGAIAWGLTHNSSKPSQTSGNYETTGLVTSVTPLQLIQFADGSRIIVKSDTQYVAGNTYHIVGSWGLNYYGIGDVTVK